ncbi:hypothetical protein AVEN_85667-1 [Araneus ventricosus]|uniref:Uncharacterized protein n=1 Tax=Araneus ventricosus TaxID=182803 RepID=A0A4Y2U6H2_ARAVE|nr:hypothetical protein AVEN_85667-1 [Araneus ventricosus]
MRITPEPATSSGYFHTTSGRLIPKNLTYTMSKYPADSLIESGLDPSIYNCIVAKVLLWVYGVNSPTRRIMENEGWIASTYQRDTEPRDYQEFSQVDEPRVRGMPIPRGCLPKSELIRDFQSELITQLSSVLRSLKTQFETPNAVSPSVRFSPRTSRFIQPFKKWSSAYLYSTG